jgi:Holliday junction resolvase RusA-like endonuclease
MTPIVFTVAGKPEPAGSKRALPWRARDGRSGTSIVDANPKSRGWKTQVSEAAAAAFSGELLNGPLSVELVFEVPRPQGHFGKHGLLASAPAHPTTRPDVLKLARAVEDAITGTIWRDDAQIVREVLVKTYGEQSRLTVRIERPWGLVETANPEQPLLISDPIHAAASGT